MKTLNGKPVIILPCVEPKYEPKKKSGKSAKWKIAKFHQNTNGR